MKDEGGRMKYFQTASLPRFSVYGICAQAPLKRIGVLE